MESPFIGFVSTVNHHCGKKALYEVAFELAPTRLFLGERKKGRGGDSSAGPGRVLAAIEGKSSRIQCILRLEAKATASEFW